MNSLTDSFILPLIADVVSAVTHEGLWPPFSAYLEIICDLSGPDHPLPKILNPNGSFSGWIDKWMNLRWSYMLAQMSVLNWQFFWPYEIFVFCFVFHTSPNWSQDLFRNQFFVCFLSHLGEGPEECWGVNINVLTPTWKQSLSKLILGVFSCSLCLQ